MRGIDSGLQIGCSVRQRGLRGFDGGQLFGGGGLGQVGQGIGQVLGGLVVGVLRQGQCGACRVGRVGEGLDFAIGHRFAGRGFLHGALRGGTCGPHGGTDIGQIGRGLVGRLGSLQGGAHSLLCRIGRGLQFGGRGVQGRLCRLHSRQLRHCGWRAQSGHRSGERLVGQLKVGLRSGQVLAGRLCGFGPVLHLGIRAVLAGTHCSLGLLDRRLRLDHGLGHAVHLRGHRQIGLARQLRHSIERDLQLVCRLLHGGRGGVQLGLGFFDGGQLRRGGRLPHRPQCAVVGLAGLRQGVQVQVQCLCGGLGGLHQRVQALKQGRVNGV